MIFNGIDDLSDFIHYKDDLYFLKLFEQYSSTTESVDIRYSYDKQLIKWVKSNYEDFPVEVSGESELAFLIKIRKWVNSILFYPHSDRLEQYEKDRWRTEYILRKMQESPFACDCGTYSLVLAELLLSLGYRARWVQCLPLDLRYQDSHVVVQVYLCSLQKWIILDPSFNCCYFNSQGIPMSLAEMRLAFSIGSKMFIPFCENKRQKTIFRYLLKNMIRFRCMQDNHCGMLVNSEAKVFLNLNPKLLQMREWNNFGYKEKYFYSEKAFWAY